MDNNSLQPTANSQQPEESGGQRKAVSGERFSGRPPSRTDIMWLVDVIDRIADEGRLLTVAEGSRIIEDLLAKPIR